MASWSIGIQHPGTDNFTYFGDVTDNWTFPDAMRELRDQCLKRMEAFNKDGYPHSFEKGHSDYLTLIGAIQEVLNDPGIMDDPDQWEDMDFPGPFDDEWYIVED